MKVVAIIQARMGSTRLPGKVLLDLAGAPVLQRVARRTHRAKKINALVIATTAHPADDTIATWCMAQGWPHFRGSEDDVLDRYYRAAQQTGAEVVVRITADCPLIDPGLLDRVIDALPAADYACNFLPARAFPRGLDAEAFTFAALERAQNEVRNPAWREHVTTYLLRHPQLFRQRGITADRDCSGYRWTLDTPEDLDLIRRIYGEFEDDDFTWEEALAVMERHPEWNAINQHIEQKAV